MFGHTQHFLDEVTQFVQGSKNRVKLTHLTPGQTLNLTFALNINITQDEVLRNNIQVAELF